MFADAPWVIAPPAWIADYPNMYGEFWPAERRMGRLHAMGYDAYNLVSRLFGGNPTQQLEMSGATGRLYLDDDGKVHRHLAWAQFERGEPVALPEIEVFDDALQQDVPEEDELFDTPVEWRIQQLNQ
jgi:hypothetical protein